MRRIRIIPFAFILALLLAFPARAAEPCKAASAYCVGDSVYAFLNADGDSLPEEVSLVVNNSQIASAKPEAVSQTDRPVRYLYLIDLSTSMYKYEDCLTAFSDALFETETQKAEVTIAGFGERFEVLREGLTTGSAAHEAIQDLEYNHEATDICGGVLSALDFLSNQAPENGAITNLVLLTDGIPWPALTSESAGSLAALKSAITDSPEVIFHSVTFSQGTPEIQSALSGGTGVALSAESEGAAAEGGAAAAKLEDGLYSLSFTSTFEIGEPRFDAQLFFPETQSADMAFLSLNHLRNFSVPAAAQSPAPATPKPSFEPEPTPVPSASSMPDASSEPGSSSAPEGMESEPSSSGEASSGPESSALASDAPSAAPTAPGSGLSIPVYVWIAVAVAVLLLVVCLIVALLKRSRKKPAAPVVGIAMRLEVLNGRQKGEQDVFHLRENLLIGSSPDCDLVWRDKAMPPRAARIFVQEQVIYIEGLSSEVLVGGIKIPGPNRLRSGDEITIGDVRFRFRF